MVDTDRAKLIGLAAKQSLLNYTKLTFRGYKANWHHKVIAEALTRVGNGECRRLIICLPPRYGKALEVNTPIATPYGWKKIGELKIGDEVFSADGVSTKVIAISPVWKDRELWRVTSDDGASVLADSDHEWVVRLCRKHRVYKRKTTKYLAERLCKRNPEIAAHKAIQIDDVELPIDPYVLGVWLGNGCSSHATITAADDDAKYLRPEIEKRGYKTTDRSTPISFGVLGLQKKLRECGLIKNKHIPDNYFWCSEGQRMDLLCGLIDTDGHVSPKGQIEFCSTNLALAEGVLFLVRSLGYKAAMCVGRSRCNGKDYGEKYRIHFYADNVAILPRKLKFCRKSKIRSGRYLTFQKVGIGDTVCIQVEHPSGEYLAGKGLLRTHNSELASIRFPPWYLANNPTKNVIVATYAQDFADDLGRKARMVMMNTHHRAFFKSARLAPDNRAVSRWSTVSGGSYYAVGVGGPLTGRGANCLLIDDPIKNRAEAESALIRDQLWDWYRSTAYTRLEDNGAVVIISTRWHESDLVGRVLQSGEDWEILNFPAIAEKDEEFRKAGEPLWPQKYGLEELQRIQETIGEREWAALFQQRPAPLSGALFNADKIIPVDSLPRGKMVRAWDLASVSDGGDWTVGILMVGYERTYGIMDVIRFRGGPHEVEKMILDTAIRDGSGVPIYIPEDPGQAGKSQSAYLAGKLAGFRVNFVRMSGSKTIRAEPFASQVNAGNVFMQRAAWNSILVDELKSFPVGRHDDQVDALSLGFSSLIDRGGGLVYA